MYISCCIVFIYFFCINAVAVAFYSGWAGANIHNKILQLWALCHFLMQLMFYMTRLYDVLLTILFLSFDCRGHSYKSTIRHIIINNACTNKKIIAPSTTPPKPTATTHSPSVALTPMNRHT